MSSHLPEGDDPDLELGPTPTLHQLLKIAVARNASDLHLMVGAPPCLRIDGEMHALRAEPLTPRDTVRLCQQKLTEQQIERFAANHGLRMSFGIPDLGRFRGSFFMQRGAMAGVYRIIPFAVPTLEELGLASFAPIISVRRGLVLVGGPLGSGKTTTIASLLSAIARERGGHFLTIEDPMEFQIPHVGKAIVGQIEIGLDYATFKDAFAAAMAQDPDVLMISELTGLDAIEGAIEAAETGRLVIAASPSRSIAKAIARLVDAYPVESQPRARARLSDVLEAVTCQTVTSHRDRRLTCELVTADGALRARVREGSALLE